MNARSWWHEQEWSNRRILFLLAVGTLIVSVIWRLPSELDFISHHLGEIIIALVLALGFTYTLRPAVNATEKVLARALPQHKTHARGRRTWATTLVFLGVIGLIWGFANIGLKPVALDARSFWDSFMAHSPEERQTMISRWERSLDQALKPYQGLLPAGTLDRIESAIPNAIDSAQTQLSAWALRSFSHLGFLVELILVPVLVFYFLADGRALRDELKLLCPQRWCARVGRMMTDLDRVLDGYIRGQVIMCLIAWILVTIGLLILRVPHPFALGILAGLTRAVPIIGPLLGAIPLALVCLLFTQSLETTGILLTLFTTMHFLESKVLLPKIIGHEVDLHPVSVIITLLLGMELFGFVGVILAVPLAALIKIILIEARYTSLVEADGSTPVIGEAEYIPPPDLTIEAKTSPSPLS